MAVLGIKAFCDESYAHPETVGDKPFVIAGYLAPARVWMEFEGWWNLRLKREGLTDFHMAACEGGYDQFKDMDRPERERLQREFIGIINGLKLIGVAAGVSQTALASAREELSKYRVRRTGEKQYMVEPYLFAFEVCVDWMIAYIKDLPEYEKIAFIFDQQNEFEGRAHKVLSILVNAEQYRNRQRIGPLTYETKTTRGCIGIQAADILAYEVMRELRDPDNHRWQMTALRQGYGIAGPRYYTAGDVIGLVERLHVVSAEAADDSMNR